MRRRKAKKIAILPDPRFNEVLVTKFVNNLMYDGKKSLAYKIFYEAIDIVDSKVEEMTGLEVEELEGRLSKFLHLFVNQESNH